MDIMTALFDEEEVMRRYINNTVKTAVNEAVNAARKKYSESVAINLIKIGKITYEEIAQSTGLSIKEVEELAALQTV